MVEPILEPPRRPARRPSAKRRKAAQGAAASSSEISFPSADKLYQPDNNSSNVINKDLIDPPPNEEELARGFCSRQLTNGKIRLVCVTCGKHYTTLYNVSGGFYKN